LTATSRTKARPALRTSELMDRCAFIDQPGSETIGRNPLAG
jgi:hypothetical protein